jgi:hypothetical protein
MQARRVALAFLFTLAAASPALAQTPAGSPPAATDTTPQIDPGAGVQIAAPSAASSAVEAPKTFPRPAGSPSTTAPASSFLSLLEQGTAERRGGDQKKAVTTLTAAIDKAPGNPEGYSERALAHIAASAYDLALIDLNKALQLLGETGPKALTAQNFVNRGLVYQQQKIYERALADFDRALTFDPATASAHANRALVHILTKAPDKAMADAQRALELRPTYEFGHYVRGLAASDLRRFDQATADFLKVLQTTPDHRGAIFGLKRADLKGAEQETESLVALVRDSRLGCEPACAEWIAIQGRISNGMADQLKPILKGLAGRKVPVFVDSGGGAVSEAMDMGRAIRAAGLDVAVTHTTVATCAKSDDACRKRQSGGKIAGAVRGEGSVCASSCGFLLAAGTRRNVGKSSLVGVHQVASFQTYQEVRRRYEIRKEWRGGKLVEVDRRLISEERGDRQTVATETKDTTYAKIRTYYTEMGTDAAIMSLLVSAPHKGMYWLTPDDLARTNARTHTVDGKALLAGVLPPATEVKAAPKPDTGPAIYTLSSDDDAALVKAIQTQLIRIGCYTGGEDGKWGSGVRRGVERYNVLTGKAVDTGGPSAEVLDAVSSQKGRVCPVQ